MNSDFYSYLMTSYIKAVFEYGIFSDEAKAADRRLYDNGNLVLSKMTDDDERDEFKKGSDEWYASVFDRYWSWIRGRRAECDRSIETYNFLGPRH